MKYYKVCGECNASMYWDEDEKAWVCVNCENRIYTDETDFDGVDDDDDDMPIFCVSCGNCDNYPNCWDSCSRNPDNR